MASLAMARQKVVSPSVPRIRRGESGTLSFSALNRKGMITLLLFATILCSGVVYLFLLSRVFELGFQVQGISRRMPELTDEVQTLELDLQRRQFAFDGSHAEAAAAMEKISSVKYLTPKNVSMSRGEPKITAE